MNKGIGFSLLTTTLMLAACTAEAPAPVAQEERQVQFRTTATIQELMDAIVDPAADYIWDSVAVIYTEDGVDEHRPQSEEDWQMVRYRALTLSEAANLLKIEGRRVAAEGATLEDADLEGIATPEEIQNAINQNPQAFAAFATGLQGAVDETLAAIDARDVDALLRSGETIDEACEQCHSTYWYPDVQY